MAEDGSKANRKDVQLYVKDEKLYALPVSFEFGGNALKLVANNFVIDSYNGKEYETVLGEDGRLYDLKETIKYPENFVNEGIASIGNNLDSIPLDNSEEATQDMEKEKNNYEIEVIYKNGDKIKFNYQTGEVISLTEEKQNKIELFDYVQRKVLEIGKISHINKTNKELKSSYEASKVLQNKLEETPIEEVLEEQNNNINKENSTANNSNNSLKETKYISIYNAKKDDYQIYQEEELLDTSKQEVISENEKIEANNLKEYYASEGKARNTNMGIVWIALSIIGVVIILFAIKKRN